MNRLSLLLLLSAVLLSTGCASLMYPSHDDVQVVTDPPGATATCGGARVVTPGTLRISRRKTDFVVVRVEKEGYEAREVVIARNHLLPMKPWGVGLGVIAVSAWAAKGCESIDWPDCQASTLATALAAAVVTGAGLAIDSASPRTHPLPRNEIVLRLEPVHLPEVQEGEPR